MPVRERLRSKNMTDGFAPRREVTVISWPMRGSLDGAADGAQFEMLSDVERTAGRQKRRPGAGGSPRQHRFSMKIHDRRWIAVGPYAASAILWTGAGYPRLESKS